MKTLEELFDYTTPQSEMKSFFKEIQETFVKPKYSSISKEYYPYLYKLLTYRKFDNRSKYREDEIRTWFVGKRDGNNSIMFYDIYGHCDCIGITKAIGQWQKEKWNYWEVKKDAVLGVLRNIGNIYVDKFRDQLKFPITDEITGETLYDIKDCHIDHYDDDFVKVAFDWIYLLKKKHESYNKNHCCDIIDILWRNIDDKKLYFKLRETSMSFYDFHKDHTHLRAISKHNNLSREKTKVNWDILKSNGYYIEKYEKEQSN